MFHPLMATTIILKIFETLDHTYYHGITFYNIIPRREKNQAEPSQRKSLSVMNWMKFRKGFEPSTLRVWDQVVQHTTATMALSNIRIDWKLKY